MSKEFQPYNPLDKKNLGVSVAEALLKKQPVPLGVIGSFEGAGIYAIYYTGKFPCYSSLTTRESGQVKLLAPIYVGKAIPPGARKGNVGLDVRPGPALWKRLVEHGKSIEITTNLDVDDFLCRYLVVEDIWIPLGESLLIAWFSPVWNHLVDGFGNHDPGSGRYNQLRSRWDVLHPGRSWADKCKPRGETQEQIMAEVEEYFRANSPRQF